MYGTCGQPRISLSWAILSTVQGHMFKICIAFWVKQWKIGLWTMLGLSYQLCKSWQNMSSNIMSRNPLENHGHVVILSSPTTYVMHMHVSLEYKCNWVMTISVRLWVDANPDKVFIFQQEIIASTLIGLKFPIKIQTAS